MKIMSWNLSYLNCVIMYIISSLDFSKPKWLLIWGGTISVAQQTIVWGKHHD